MTELTEAYLIGMIIGLFIGSTAGICLYALIYCAGRER